MDNKLNNNNNHNIENNSHVNNIANNNNNNKQQFMTLENVKGGIIPTDNSNNNSENNTIDDSTSMTDIRAPSLLQGKLGGGGVSGGMGGGVGIGGMKSSDSVSSFYSLKRADSYQVLPGSKNAFMASQSMQNLGSFGKLSSLGGSRGKLGSSQRLQQEMRVDRQKNENTALNTHLHTHVCDILKG